jgi:transcriptional regulator with XRE-family HTH domain
MTFGERLKKARIEKGLTQEQLANLIGVAKSTVTGYEKNNREPNFFIIKKILEVLNISFNDLMGTDFGEPQKQSSDLSEHERIVIKAYRRQPAMQPAVDKLLGVESDDAPRPSLADDMIETIHNTEKDLNGHSSPTKQK